MSRATVIEALSDFAGPLGLFGSLNQKLDRRDAWAAAADEQTRAGLADVLVQPASRNQLAPADPGRRRSS